MALNRAAEYLGITPKTLRRAAEAGKIAVKHPLADGPWIFHRTDLEQWKGRTEILKNRGAGDPTGPAANQESFGFSTT
jgi:predicted site-specific integrase-resolvase